jgi:hypothetical protein
VVGCPRTRAGTRDSGSIGCFVAGVVRDGVRPLGGGVGR